MKLEQFLREAPLECLLEVSRYTNIGDIESVCDATNVPHLQAVIRDRGSPHTYFKPLVKDTTTLFVHMLETGSVLSGSRAAGYFYPSAYREGSDWDFLCHNHKAVEFAIRLQQMGVVWEGRPTPKSRNPYRGMNVICGRLGSQAVQVISTQGMNPIGQIMGYHSTLVQCFISASCAVSIYHELSRKGISVALEGKSEVRQRTSGLSWRDEYKSRGFDIREPAEARATLPPYPAVRPRVRSITSGTSLVVELASYTQFDADNSTRVERDLSLLQNVVLRDRVGTKSRSKVSAVPPDEAPSFVHVDATHPRFIVSSVTEGDGDLSSFVVLRDKTVVSTPWLDAIPGLTYLSYEAYALG